MVTPLNKDLQNLRVSLEHYKNILKNDELLKKEGNPDNKLLLSDDDINKINLKIEAISEKIIELLDNDNGYVLDG